MKKHTANGAAGVESRLVHAYDADLLGAPFKVTLIDSVKEEFCVETGTKLRTVIPDLQGVLRAAAAQRAMLPRRLGGAEIRFLRNAISFKSKEMADKLSMSPEHYSRVENDSKALGSQAEQFLRAFVITKLYSDKDMASKFVRRIVDVMDLKIEGAWPVGEELEVKLMYVRKEREQDNSSGSDLCANDNGDWYDSSSLQKYG